MALYDSIGSTVTGALTGAAVMFFFDPQRGRSRRARLFDRLARAEHELADAGTTAARDLRNRGRGLAHDLAVIAHPDHPDDDVLLERVRSRLGRAVPHPGGIEVSCARGVVTLAGPVLRAELEPLVRQVRHVRGVRDVVNRLEPHDHRDKTPLRGTRRFRALRFSPAAGLLIAGGVGALALAAAVRALRA